MAAAKMLVAIHQPNFFPWLGYFNKLVRADVFVVLDSVQFPRTGAGTWCNRVRLLVNRRPTWVTMPVDRRGSASFSIRDMRIASEPWRPRMVRTLQMAYGGAPHFAEVFPALRGLIADPAEWVAEYNLATIRALARHMALDVDRMIVASTLSVRGNATDLLIGIVRAVGGTAYICGGGAQGYQEDEKFGAAGIELVKQNFRHPVYSQRGITEFVPGLSIVDALMNCGFEGARNLVMGLKIENDQRWVKPADGRCLPS